MERAGAGVLARLLGIRWRGGSRRGWRGRRSTSGAHGGEVFRTEHGRFRPRARGHPIGGHAENQTEQADESEKESKAQHRRAFRDERDCETEQCQAEHEPAHGGHRESCVRATQSYQKRGSLKKACA